MTKRPLAVKLQMRYGARFALIAFVVAIGLQWATAKPARALTCYRDAAYTVVQTSFSTTQRVYCQQTGINPGDLVASHVLYINKNYDAPDNNANLATWTTGIATYRDSYLLPTAAATGTWRAQYWYRPLMVRPNLVNDGAVNTLQVFDYNNDGNDEICAGTAGGSVGCVTNAGASVFGIDNADPVYSSAMAQDGTNKYLLTGDNLGNVRRYHTPSNETLLTNYGYPIYGMAAGNISGGAFADDFGFLDSKGEAGAYDAVALSRLWTVTTPSIAKAWVSDTYPVAVKDLNGDGKMEVLVGGTASGTHYLALYNGASGAMMAGWPKAVGASTTEQIRSVLIGDTDNDGVNEIAAGSTNNYTYVWEISGATVRSMNCAYDVNAIAIGDVDSDGKNEVIAGTDSPGRIYVLNDSGTTLVRNPETTVAAYITAVEPVSSLRVAPVLGGTRNMIIMGGKTQRVAVYNGIGRLVWRTDFVTGNPAGRIYSLGAGSLNPSVDSVPDIAAGSGDGYIYAFGQSTAESVFTVAKKAVVTQTFAIPGNGKVQVTAGQTDWPLVQITVNNTVESAGTAAEINRLRFGIIATATVTVLTNAVINSMFSSYSVYLENNGNNIFEPGVDIDLTSRLSAAPTLTAGYLYFNFKDNELSGDVDPNNYLLVNPLSTKKFYFVATTKSTAPGQAFRIYNVNTSAHNLIWDNNIESGTVITSGTAYTTASPFLTLQALPGATINATNALYVPETTLSPGDTGKDMSQVKVTNTGAANRATIEVRTLRFKFSSDAGGTTPIDPATRFSNLKLYVENNANDAFNGSATDPEVPQDPGSPAIDSVAGTVTFTLTNNTPNALISAANGSKKYYLAADVQVSSPTGTFYVSHNPVGAGYATIRENNADTNISVTGVNGATGPFSIVNEVKATVADTGLSMANSSTDDLMSVQLTNSQGNALQVTAFKFIFTKDGTTAMTTAQAQALFGSLAIYQDDGNGVFDSGLDTQLVSVPSGSFSLDGAGEQAISLADTIGAGAARTYFLAATMQANATGATTKTYAVSHNPSSQITADVLGVPATVTPNALTQGRTLKAAYWKVTVGGATPAVYGSAVVEEGTAGYSNRVYVGGDDGVLRALDLATGNTLWTYTAGGAIRSDVFWWYDSFTVGFTKIRVHFTADDGKVYTLTDNGASVTEGWVSAALHAGMPDRVTPTARVYNSNPKEIRLYVGCQNGATSHVHAFNATDGTVKWTSSPAIPGNIQANKASNSSVFAGSANGTFYKLQTSDGTWAQAVATAGSIAGSVNLNSMSLWFAGGNTLYCRKYSNLTQTCAGWTDFTAGGTIQETPWTTGGGSSTKVFVGTSEGAVYGVNLTTGAQAWRYPAAGNIGAVRSQIFEDLNVSLYFLADDGYVYDVAVSNGALQANWPAYVGMAASPAISSRSMAMMSNGGYVIVGTTNGNIFALPKD